MEILGRSQGVGGVYGTQSGRTIHQVETCSEEPGLRVLGIRILRFRVWSSGSRIQNLSVKGLRFWIKKLRLRM
jgi:hypothetical protein